MLLSDCGCVYEVLLDASWTATSMASLLCGTTAPDPAANAGQRCDVNGIASPDNLAFQPPDNLYVYEDTSRHTNDMMWHVKLSDDVSAAPHRLTRILTSPYGSEVTGGLYTQRVGRWSYLMAVVQHPYSESDNDKVHIPTNRAATARQGLRCAYVYVPSTCCV